MGHNTFATAIFILGALTAIFLIVGLPVLMGRGKDSGKPKPASGEECGGADILVDEKREPIVTDKGEFINVKNI